jgi:cysteine desulfurase/selenocysteine lyase
MNLKDDFPILKNRDITYLDSGATAQKPKEVIEAIEKYYENYNANPHRGAYSLSIEATEKYEDTRTKIANFINSKNREEIIFSKNASESLNLIAYSYGLEKLNEGDEICISIMEHHSNLVPWQKVASKTGAKLVYLYMNDEFEIPEEEWKTKITNKTKIVGITHISNVLGTINPIKDIIKYAHKKGAVVLVDASQSIPHMRIDVQALDADFLVFSGHKMMAPLGIGVLYGKKELLNKIPPFLMGGDMIEYVYEQNTTYAPLPNKFEAGTQNVEGVIGLGAAIDYIEKVGYDKIQEIEKEVVEYAIFELSKLEYLDLYLTPNRNHHSGVISFNIKGVHPHDVASILDSEGICVRSRKSLCATTFKVNWY